MGCVSSTDDKKNPRITITNEVEDGTDPFESSEENGAGKQENMTETSQQNRHPPSAQVKRTLTYPLGQKRSCEPRKKEERRARIRMRKFKRREAAANQASLEINGRNRTSSYPRSKIDIIQLRSRKRQQGKRRKNKMSTNLYTPGVRKWDTDSTFSLGTPSAEGTHLGSSEKPHNYDLRVTPIISEEFLMFDSPQSQNSKMRTFHLRPNHEHEWGMLINFTQHWSEWRIRRVERKGQVWALGVRQNWYIVGVNNIVLNAENAIAVRNELMKGQACDLTLSQEQPVEWANKKDGQDVGVVASDGKS